MYIDSHSLLAQLGYHENEATLKQMDKIISNTKEFDKFSKHILSLLDHIKHTNSIIAMSNSNDFLKIKFEGNSPELLDEFQQITKAWAEKYNISLQKVPKKEVFYILGTK